MHALHFDALVLDSRSAPSPHQPHRFEPRKFGSSKACEICGARRDDEIHTNRPPRPSDR